VREDFNQQCAYCLLPELLAGGEENFELDHFRPKAVFLDKVNDFYNLYYACHPCNHIKRDAWPPAALEARGIGFVDLCKSDFWGHFQSGTEGLWEGVTDSGRYTIDILRLNRRHLVTVRKLLDQLGFALHAGKITESDIKQLAPSPKKKVMSKGAS
jgi:hypothetical protein